MSGHFGNIVVVDFEYEPRAVISTLSPVTFPGCCVWSRTY
jgi:hypothetical protein